MQVSKLLGNTDLRHPPVPVTGLVVTGEKRCADPRTARKLGMDRPHVLPPGSEGVRRSAKVPTGASNFPRTRLFRPTTGQNVQRLRSCKSVRSTPAPRIECRTFEEAPRPLFALRLSCHGRDAEEGGRGVGDAGTVVLNSTGRHGGAGVVAILQRAACSVQVVVVATTLARPRPVPLPGPMNAAAAVAEAL